MALRAFHDNPCIGGFGGESTVAIRSLEPGDDDEERSKSGDALCQIIKELVDNAVDGCKSKGGGQRVKVEIFPYQDDEQILKIQVSDTGVGMEDIQKCVEAFESSKGRSKNKTAGRYGVGLTLCMLHAQRLVSNSYCCITSATKEQKSYTRAFFVVDTDGNSVVCKKVERLEKPSSDESGTCVSVLVPGGATAETAWPRVENYFTRFRLRPMTTNAGPDLEVLAPTLSKQPIFVRSRSNKTGRIVDDNLAGAGEEQYADDLEGDRVDDSDKRQRKLLSPAQRRLETQRKATFHAAQSFFGCSAKLENVAYAMQNIRIPNTKGSEPAPKLEVEIIVRPDYTDSLVGKEEPIATLRLIRMVNSIPMLDSAEGYGCGLVHGLANKLIWGSFGLHVTQSNERNQHSWTPLFDVRDSDQVASFFQQRQHRQSDETRSADGDFLDNGEKTLANMRKLRSGDAAILLPAKLRLSDITVLVRIQAAPTTLPLPTLSKGRLPLNHSPIDVALQRCLRECLRSLQRTNPQLLLTPTQLRSTVREVRYIPALALAVSQIVSRSSKGTQQIHDDIQQWRDKNHHGRSGQRDVSDLHLDEATICTFTEERLRCMLEAKQARLLERKTKKQRTAEARTEEIHYSDLDESDVEADVANPRVVSLHDEPPNISAWADFTEVFRNPPLVSPGSPEEGSSTMNTPEDQASHRSSAQDSVVDDDWW